MALFYGTFVNKLDGKGRVSVPKEFRRTLDNLGSQSGIVIFPSFRHPALECCASGFLEQLGDSNDDIPMFSEQEDDVTSAIFGAAREIPFDPEGRIVLPQPFREHAKIADAVAFVGHKERFQIWEPAARAAFDVVARERASRNGLTLKIPHKKMPSGGGGT